MYSWLSILWKMEAKNEHVLVDDLVALELSYANLVLCHPVLYLTKQWESLLKFLVWASFVCILLWLCWVGYWVLDGWSWSTWGWSISISLREVMLFCKKPLRETREISTIFTTLFSLNLWPTFCLVCLITSCKMSLILGNKLKVFFLNVILFYHPLITCMDIAI